MSFNQIMRPVILEKGFEGEALGVSIGVLQQEHVSCVRKALKAGEIGLCILLTVYCNCLVILMEGCEVEIGDVGPSVAVHLSCSEEDCGVDWPQCPLNNLRG